MLFLCLFFALGIRLAYIQLIKGSHYAAVANKMHVLTIPAENPPRGNILDRYGQSLIDTELVNSLIAIPSMIQEPSQLAETLAEILDIPPAEALEQLNANVPARSAIILKEGLHQEEIEELQELKAAGIFIVPTRQRYGPDSLARHLIGYEDLIGVKGIEALYEKYLKGTISNYSLSAVVDGIGNVVKGWGFSLHRNYLQDQVRGDVVLTIDSRVQKIIEQVLDKRGVAGAVVIIDIPSGDVLGMASRPNFEQNYVVNSFLKNEQGSALINRSFKPYISDSIFKSVIALTAIESGQVQLNERFTCTGSYTLPFGADIFCWEKEGHGELSFKEAFALSCYPVFIETGLRIGALLGYYSEKLGLNQQELIGYDSLQGINALRQDLGSKKVADAFLKQEGIRLSPLQVANLMATLGRRGSYITPRIVKKIIDHQGSPILEFSQDPPMEVFSEETTRKVDSLLDLLTVSGTGKDAWVAKWGAADKTVGTKPGRLDENSKSVYDIWFAGYGPSDNPRLAIAVLIEDGSAGRQIAALVFQEIAELILGR
jgi:cell division protein FtsI/penicillin-binding protein 2